ncbi:metallophosphoesterase [Fundicoccus culcitae]|uniref:Metallophosphoesterase n=1 Tax=Fundicoccus culcitae TaxID=2969821 RepID=A0ABY5P5C3_9LACT|nr:metallophosphoesterase [Fundicoccus culcitae]UUX33889.1 metallophosphoesterase [Fundicoccus culcitae]
MSFRNKNSNKYLCIFAILVFFTSQFFRVTQITYAETKEWPSDIVLAVLPDTQLYSKYSPEIFESQTSWIAENQASENIDFVLHVGDIVNEAYNISQWESASNVMEILEEAKINYAIVTGNHDVDYSRIGVEDVAYYDDMRNELENYPKYFPVERFASMSTFGGSSPNGYNTYHFIAAEDYQIMVLALDWLPSDETLDWAQDILKQYSKTPTIILKHDFIRPRKNDHSGEVQISGEETQKQWEIFKEYNQIFMTLNGHFTGSDYGTLKNAYGNDVFMTSVDFQGKVRGGNGWMRLMTLDIENSRINGTTFSPYVMSLPLEEREAEDLEYLEDEANQFSFPFDLKTRFEQISN